MRFIYATGLAITKMIFFVSTSTGKLFNQIDNFNANYLINI